MLEVYDSMFVCLISRHFASFSQLLPWVWDLRHPG